MERGIYRLSYGINQSEIEHGGVSFPTCDKLALFGYKKRNQCGDVCWLTYGSQRTTVLKL